MGDILALGKMEPNKFDKIKKLQLEGLNREKFLEDVRDFISKIPSGADNARIFSPTVRRKIITEGVVSEELIQFISQRKSGRELLTNYVPENPPNKNYIANLETKVVVKKELAVKILASVRKVTGKNNSELGKLLGLSSRDLRDLSSGINKIYLIQLEFLARLFGFDQVVFFKEIQLSIEDCCEVQTKNSFESENRHSTAVSTEAETVPSDGFNEPPPNVRNGRELGLKIEELYVPKDQAYEVLLKIQSLTKKTQRELTAILRLSKGTLEGLRKKRNRLRISQLEYLARFFEYDREDFFKRIGFTRDSCIETIPEKEVSKDKLPDEQLSVQSREIEEEPLPGPVSPVLNEINTRAVEKIFATLPKQQKVSSSNLSRVNEGIILAAFFSGRASKGSQKEVFMGYLSGYLFPAEITECDGKIFVKYPEKEKVFLDITKIPFK